MKCILAPTANWRSAQDSIVLDPTQPNETERN